MAPVKVKELQHLIFERYGGDSSHIASVPVKETFEDKTVWEGNVEVFHVIGLPNANACYAWYSENGGQTRPIVVLEIPPVHSASSAVRTVIAEKKKRA